jgi:hyperosmotically inducible protein
MNRNGHMQGWAALLFAAVLFAGGSSEAAVQDSWITAKVKMKFMADHDIPATDVHVDTHDRTVTLFGTVPSRPVADKAESVARGVRGVSDVENELKVAGERRGG